MDASLVRAKNDQQTSLLSLGLSFFALSSLV